jgi:hypothetical protein
VTGFGLQGPVALRIVLEVGCVTQLAVIGARSFAERFGHKGLYSLLYVALSKVTGETVALDTGEAVASNPAIIPNLSG